MKNESNVVDLNPPPRLQRIAERRYRVRYGTGAVEVITVAMNARNGASSGLWCAVGFDGYRALQRDPEAAAGACAQARAFSLDTHVCNLAPEGAPVPLDEAERDWRPFPTADQVLAHNDRTGGDCYGPWLRLRHPDDEYEVAEVEMLAVSGHDRSVEILDKDDTDTAGLWRPITRRMEALPWP